MPVAWQIGETFYEPGLLDPLVLELRGRVNDPGQSRKRHRASVSDLFPKKNSANGDLVFKNKKERFKKRLGRFGKFIHHCFFEGEQLLHAWPYAHPIEVCRAVPE